MCWCSCRLACILSHSFQSLSWGWFWMVLWTLMLFPIFYCTAGKLKQFRNLRGPLNTLSLDCNGSEVVNCNLVEVDRYIVFLIWLIAVATGKWFGAGLVFWDSLLGVSSYAVSTLSTDGLFFVWGFLRGMQADKILDALSSRSEKSPIDGVCRATPSIGVLQRNTILRCLVQKVNDLFLIDEYCVWSQLKLHIFHQFTVSLLKNDWQVGRAHK
jgi:hypothetical protein